MSKNVRDIKNCKVLTLALNVFLKNKINSSMKKDIAKSILKYEKRNYYRLKSKGL